jgi:hypothetical protein
MPVCCAQQLVIEYASSQGTLLSGGHQYIPSPGSIVYNRIVDNITFNWNLVGGFQETMSKKRNAERE